MKFSAVGFELVIDEQGFAYINGERDNLINKKLYKGGFLLCIHSVVAGGRENPVQYKGTDVL